MILKFLTDVGWSFIDKVDRIETVYIKEKGNLDKLAKVLAYIHNRTDIEIIECAENPKVVYLLNDSGKTIEKIL